MAESIANGADLTIPNIKVIPVQFVQYNFASSCPSNND